MLSDPNLNYNLLKHLVNHGDLNSDYLDSNPLDNFVDEPLDSIYPDLDKVGLLADEFDKNSTYSEDEGIEDYKKGGYHPVFIGEILNGRYVILQKLGWGHFSTVWLARDVKYGTYVAIKVQKSASHYLEAAFDEVEILQKAVKHAHDPRWIKDLHEIYGPDKTEFGVDDCHVVQLLNAFIYQGPYGRHFCMVFEVLGVNLLEIIKRYDYKGIPLPICRRMARQILIGLHYLHKYCGIIHTDLKPENVLVCLGQKELKEIFDSGQLNNSKRMQARLRAVRRKIRELHNEAPDEEELAISENGFNFNTDFEEDLSPSPSRNFAFEEDNGQPGEHNGALFANILKMAKNPSSELVFKKDSEDQNELEDEMSEHTLEKNALILTEEDLQKELDRIIAEKNITNKKDKKNLRKKLKRRLKRNKQKPDHEIATESTSTVKKATVPPESLRIDIFKKEISAAAQAPASRHPQFHRSGLTEDFKIKIADLGNGCWVHHHFQPEIQTRQYRSPEVILGVNYSESADVWSFACMLFEMLTGEFLFDPKKDPSFSKSTDHLALMMELLNKFPRNFSTVGTNSKKYVDVTGALRKVPKLNFMSLKELAMKKYKMLEHEAQVLQDFLMPALRIFPASRPSAWEVLSSPWLRMTTTEIFENPDRTEEPPEFPPETRFSTAEFERVVNEEDFDADKSHASMSDNEDTAEVEPSVDFYDKECKYFDRSFKNVYVGYADGIDLNAMDNTANWQFDQKWH